MYFYELKGIYKIFLNKHILGKKIIYVIYVYKYEDLKSDDVINKQLHKIKKYIVKIYK